MKYDILTPLCVGADGCTLMPSPNHVSTDDRLFLVCNDSNLAESLIAGLNESFSKSKKITPAMLNGVIEDVLTSLGQRQKSIDLAFMMLQPSGVLMAQMGRSRTIHINCDRGEVAYDSRMQAINYNDKTRTELITKLNAGDLLILTLADRVDSQDLARRCAESDETLTLASNAIANQQGTTPASIFVSMAPRDGARKRKAAAAAVAATEPADEAPFKKPKIETDLIDDDIPARSGFSWKWVLLVLALCAAIAFGVLYSLGRNEVPEETAPADTVSTVVNPADTVMAPPEQAIPDNAIPANAPEDTPKEPSKSKEDSADKSNNSQSGAEEINTPDPIQSEPAPAPQPPAQQHDEPQPVASPSPEPAGPTE